MKAIPFGVSINTIRMPGFAAVPGGRRVPLTALRGKKTSSILLPPRYPAFTPGLDGGI